MIAAMRPDIDNVDEYVRNTTARAFSGGWCCERLVCAGGMSGERMCSTVTCAVFAGQGAGMGAAGPLQGASCGCALQRFLWVPR